MKPGLRYFTPKEIAPHNFPDDLWVSYMGKVYDFTELCVKEKGNPLLKPIIDVGGTDISHWFDEITCDIRKYVDPETHCLIPYCPNGRFLHIPPPYPDSSWANDFGCPWWSDAQYMVGFLTKKTRLINIVNVLTSQEQIIEVCSEESIQDILERYLPFNAHAASYTWKYNGSTLNMSATLEQNGIVDFDEDFYQLRMNETEYLQTIHLYFNDDLTVA
ncbi:cytochrome b5 domain-containing protein 1-like [Argonauta hians]